MAQFLVTAQPVTITAYRLQYKVDAESPEEAEEIFRNPEKYPGKLTRVRQEKTVSQPKREELPVTIQTLSEALEEAETLPMPSMLTQEA